MKATGIAMLAAMIGWAGFGLAAAQAQGFNLRSADVGAGATIKAEQVFNHGGCKGGDVSPTLSWSGAPAGTKSFALTIYDPDAPTGSGFWHWVIANIPAGTTSLAKNAGDVKAGLAPKGAVQVRNDYGLPGYGGPCPPKGPAHHYVFTLFAVDLPKLDVDARTTPAVVGFNLHYHTLAKATLTALYGQ